MKERETASHMQMLIEARLMEAARTMRRLPAADAAIVSGLKNVRAKWPDYVQEGFDAWIGYNREKASYRPDPPSAAEIDRMDEILETWLAWLQPQNLPSGLPSDLGRIVWARSACLPWSAIITKRSERHGSGIGRVPGGNSYTSLRQHYTAALRLIERRLIEHDIALDIPSDWEA